MRDEDLRDALASLAGIQVRTLESGRIEVHVGDGVPALELDAAEVRHAEPVAGPTGPAVRCQIKDKRAALFVTEGDVAFAPDTSVLRRPSGMRVRVTDLPPIAGWQDVVRMFERAEALGGDNLDRFFGQLMSCEALLAGAARAGLRTEDSDLPGRLVALREAWEQT